MPLPSASLRIDPVAVRQACRIAAACAAAFAAYRIMGMAQGYWAVFTVLIVMQGSIAGTLGAAVDRMLGTFVGAALGAVGAWAHDGSAVGSGMMLVIVTALAGYVATVRPQLKVAPVTASIMMLTIPAGEPIHLFVLDRIVEIALGGGIGVAAMALILPARSQGLVLRRAADVLDAMRTMLTGFADALESGTAMSFTKPLVEIRPALTSVESALREADREHAARLWRHALSPAIPRTLWRIRSDLVLIARALDPPFPDEVRFLLGPPGGRMLRAFAETVGAYSTAMRNGRQIEEEAPTKQKEAFAAAFAALRAGAAADALPLEVAGHVFGLSFALDELGRDLADLVDRINEANAPT